MYDNQLRVSDFVKEVIIVYKYGLAKVVDDAYALDQMEDVISVITKQEEDEMNELLNELDMKEQVNNQEAEEYNLYGNK